MKAIGALAGELRQPGIDPGDEDRDVRMPGGPGREERRHQRVLVMLTLVRQPRARLPGVPDRPQRADVIAQPRHRRLPRDAEPALDVRPHLCPEAQDEAPPRGRLQIPGRVRQHQRAAGKGDRHRRSQRDARCRIGGQHQRQKRIMVDLGGPQPGKPALLGGGGNLARTAGVARFRHQGRVELHRTPLVLGTCPCSRGSTRVAWSSARANALKSASIL